METNSSDISNEKKPTGKNTTKKTTKKTTAKKKVAKKSVATREPQPISSGTTTLNSTNTKQTDTNSTQNTNRYIPKEVGENIGKALFFVSMGLVATVAIYGVKKVIEKISE